MEQSLKRGLIIRLAIALAMVSLGLLVLRQGVGRRAAADQLVAHTLRVLGRLEIVAQLNAELQHFTEEFLVTGHDHALVERDKAQAEVGAEIRRLRGLTGAKPAQVKRIDQLERLVVAKLAFQSTVIQTARSKGLEAGRALLAERESSSGDVEIGRLLGEIEAEERRLLQVRQEASAAADAAEFWSMAAFLGIIFTVMLGAYFQVRRHLDERMRAERVLRLSEENLSVTLHSIGDGVIATDAAGRVTRLNPEAERLTGWSAAESRGRAVDEVFRIINERTREAASVPVEKVLGTGLVSGLANHTVLVSRDGSERPIADSAAPIRSRDGQVLGVVLVFRDATAERRATEQESLLRTISDNLPDGAVFQLVQEGPSRQFTYVSPSVQTLTGIGAAEFLARPELMSALIFKEDAPAVELALSNALAGFSILDTEFRIHHAGGGMRWLHLHAAPSHRPSGAIQWDGVVVDASRRKLAEQEILRLNASLENRVHQRTAELQAANLELKAEIAGRERLEEDLRRAEERYRTMADFTYDWETWQAPDGGYLYVSPSCERITGYRSDEFVAEPGLLARIVHPDDRAAVTEHIQEMFAGKHCAEQILFRVLARSGEERVIEHNCQAVHGRDRTWLGVRASNRDVTERIRMERERQALEEQYRQSQKLESVGLLAGGVSHDFNNLLTVINGYSDLMLAQVAPGDPLHVGLTQVRQAGERASDLIQQLLAFSRKQLIRPKLLDLNQVVSDMEKMLRRLISEDITLIFRQQPDLGRVLADPGRITQVLMNLTVNARDAMPDGGTLAIETANVELDDNYCADHPEVKRGQYVMMAVSDTGAGMDVATRSHLFEPFFTTKKVGRGTGLGLSTVHGIIKQAGGSIWVYSEPGHGSTFKIYLPRMEATAETVEVASEPGMLRGSETILVVEDQPELRDLVKVILNGHGYRVLSAADGSEALALSAKHHGSIDLLLTDVVMPGLTGRQLAERLSAERPAMKVIYMSGYAEDVVAHHGMVDDGMRYIQKPFTPDELAGGIRAALGLARHV